MRQIKKNTLVYPRQYFVEDLLALKEKSEILLNVVLSETVEENQWLVRKYDEDSIEAILRGKQDNNGRPPKSLLLRSTLLKNRLHPDTGPLQADFLIDGHLYLHFDEVTKTNSVSGYLQRKNRIVNLDELFLVGSKMQRVLAVNANYLIAKEPLYKAFLESDYAKERWQMTRKALGDDVWKRLCMLRVMIVGGGRSGEFAFVELSRLGVGCITLCDGDKLESRNLGEMKLVTDLDIGRNKAEVIVEKVTELRKTNEKKDRFNFRAVKSFNFEGTEPHGIAKESDVLICCVDSDAARDYASYIASRYHKVLIDIGTGIVREPDGKTAARKGYDVRTILPGDGCLRCCGGLDEAQSELEIFNSDERNRQRVSGHRRRAGSLSSLNVSAVNEGIALLQDLCKGEVANSTWIQFEKDTGRTVISPIPRSKQACDCEKAGKADLF
jgi:molybdopterin/thiamine biosynthesis adenylyltransferase